MAEFILKDWHGKEQYFDEETIYVKDKDGKLLPFTHGTGNPVIEPLNVTQNGVYTTPVGVNGFSPVSVNVPDLPPVLQSKEATQNGEYTPDSGYDGLSKVTVNVPDPVLEPLNVTVNGNYTPGTGKDGFNSVTVAVPAPEINLQEKTITENGDYTADSGFDGLGKVTVEVAGSGGGLLETPIVASGTFIPTSTSSFTVNHNLGVVPDCIEIQNVNASSGTVAATRILYAIGFRTGLLFGGSNQSAVLTSSSGGGAIWTGGNAGIDGSNSYCPFKNANETSVKIGSAIQKLEVNTEYTWIAKRLLA